MKRILFLLTALTFSMGIIAQGNSGANKDKVKEKKSSSSAVVSSKDHKKDKERTKEKSKDREESKKRKVQASTLDDEIDDLFGLLTPTNKKPKHK